MSAQLDKVVGQVEARRAELAASLEVLQLRIPDSVGYDTQGRVFLKAEGSSAPRRSPGGTLGNGTDPDDDGRQHQAVVVISGMTQSGKRVRS